MPIDPSIIGNVMAPQAVQMPDMNAMMQNRTAGMENIYKIERQRGADAAAAQKEQEDNAVKALLPAYAHALKTGDLDGALSLAPPEYQGSLTPYIDALRGKPLEEIQAALTGSLVTSEVGRAFLENQARTTTAGVQQGQLTLAQQRLAFDREKAAAEAAGGGKVAFTEVDAQGNKHFFDAYGNEIRVAQGVGKPATSAPGASTPEQKTQARQGVDGTLARIKEQYDILKKEKEIVSTKNTAMENIAARAKTKLGPSVGKTIGTKAQSARDTIANLRQALLADIKAATGMSSKAIDSNVELQSFLASLGDPDQSFETIQNTLAELSKKYGTGTLGVDDTGSATTGEAPQITSDEEFDALPSGAEFIDPEGVRRRKP